MTKKIIIENNDDVSNEEYSSDSDTLTKPKQKKHLPKKDDDIKPTPKPKKKMTENQLNNLKKGQEIMQKNREMKKLNKKIEASKILLENNIEVAPKKKPVKPIEIESEDEKPIKKKPVKKIIEESDDEEDVIIVKKKKKPKTIIIEESESDNDSVDTVPEKKRPLKSQENKKSSIKMTHQLPTNFTNFF